MRRSSAPWCFSPVVRHFPASTKAALSRQHRWQTELLFKALKLNPRIKAFVNTSSNALQISDLTRIAVPLLHTCNYATSSAIACPVSPPCCSRCCSSISTLFAWRDQPFSPAAARYRR